MAYLKQLLLQICACANKPSNHMIAAQIELPDSCPDFRRRATSGFRSTLHSHTESLRLESLDISRAVGRESLDIPKFGRESLEMGRESLCPWTTSLPERRNVIYGSMIFDEYKFSDFSNKFNFFLNF